MIKHKNPAIFRKNHILKAFFCLILSGSLFYASTAYAFDMHGLDVMVRGGVLESYDDNITYLNENRKKDFVTGISAGVGVAYKGKTGTLGLDVGVNQQIFAMHPNYNNISETASVYISQELSRYDRINASDHFSHTYEPDSFEDAFERTGGRYSYFQNDFNINYEKDLMKQLGFAVRYANSLSIISRSGISDSYLNAGGAEVRYFQSSDLNFRASYNFSNRVFTAGGNASKHDIAAGMKYNFTDKFYFDGRAGMDIMNSYNDQYYLRPQINVSLFNDLGETSRAGITFDQEFVMNAYREDLFNQWQISGIFTSQIFKRLAGRFTGFYGRGKYVTDAVEDNFWGTHAGFTYDLSERLKGSINYTYAARMSGDDVLRYTKNVVSAGVSVEF